VRNNSLAGNAGL